MKSISVKAVLLAAAGLGCCAGAMAAPTLVQDVRVFDGSAVHERRTVLIDNGVIVDANFRGSVPKDARIVSGAGRTLMPGLIDSHVHAYRHLDLFYAENWSLRLDLKILILTIFRGFGQPHAY